MFVALVSMDITRPHDTSRLYLAQDFPSPISEYALKEDIIGCATGNLVELSQLRLEGVHFGLKLFKILSVNFVKYWYVAHFFFASNFEIRSARTKSASARYRSLSLISWNRKSPSCVLKDWGSGASIQADRSTPSASRISLVRERFSAR